MCVFVVPPPVLSIVSSSTSVYAGSFIAINCSIQLSSAVDSPVSVAVMWRRNNIVFTSSANRMVLDAVLMGNSSLYVAQVIFNPVHLNNDNGAYSCEVDVDAVSSGFVVNSGMHSSSTVSLRPAGK